MEVEQIYGVVGMGLISLALPYIWQVFKVLTKWEGDRMTVVTLISTYLIMWVYYLASWLLTHPDPTASDYLYLSIGLVIYPLLVWYTTQGLYSKTMKASGNDGK